MSTDKIEIPELAAALKKSDGWIRDVSNTLTNLSAIFEFDAYFEAIRIGAGANTVFSDEHVASLLKLKHLKHLDVSSCEKLTDGGIHVLAGIASLEEIDFCECDQLSDKGLKVLSALTSLKSVKLQSCNITNSTLEVLSKLVNLEEVNVSFCDNITDDGVRHLASLPNLHVLDIGFCPQLTDESLLVISKFPALRELTVGGRTKITNANGFRHLVANCKSLTKLDVSQSAETVDDETLEIVSQLPKIEVLNFYECKKITNGGVKHLAKLQSLKALNLSECSLISIDGLMHLVKLPVLVEVNVEGTLVTDEEKEAFVKQLDGDDEDWGDDE
jgi:F-box and leucine-rich repeat protein 14